MGDNGQMIVKLPNGQVEVKARRRLKEPGAFEAFVEEIQTTLIQIKESFPDACVCDFDASQNPTTPEQFEMLFNALALANVKVQRFRLFGCPALNDEAMRHLSEHFAQDLSTESSPTELHLSDCAITTDGFLLLMNSIEEKDLYPTTIMGGRKLPLYLRMENNYIDEAVIQEKVDAGVIRPFRKVPGMRQETNDPNVKINLVVRAEGPVGFQQKKGPPPSPEDAPPPKEIHDLGSTRGFERKGWGKGKDGGKGGKDGGKGKDGRQSWGSSWGRQQIGGQQALPGQYGQPGCQSGGYGKGGSGGYGKGGSGGYGGQSGYGQGYRQQYDQQGGQRGMSNSRMGNQQQQRSGNNQWQGWNRQGGAAAADRSRTPQARGPAKKDNSLPHPWEEQWSEEYQIPYYWNSETGEALWEKPKA